MKILFDPGRPLLLDGALGTELERRGVDTSGLGWTARANLDSGQLIQSIHQEYLLAGADILSANTFRTNPRAQLGSEFDAFDLTKRAVSHAIQARKSSELVRQVLIAGSIAPAADCFSPELVPENDCDLAQEHGRFARWLKEAGVDLLLIETMSTLREAEIAFKAARRATALPIIVSIVVRDAEHLLDGTTIDDAVTALSGADLLMLNCSSLSVMLAAAPRWADLATGFEIPFGFSPNTSERLDDGTWDLNARSDEEISDAAVFFMSLGASMIGSCCGSTPSTTALIKEKIGV